MEKWKSERERSKIQHELVFAIAYSDYCTRWITYRNSSAYDLTVDRESLAIAIITLCAVELPDSRWIDLMDGVYHDLSLLKDMNDIWLRNAAGLAIVKWTNSNFPVRFTNANQFYDWLVE